MIEALRIHALVRIAHASGSLSVAALRRKAVALLGEATAWYDARDAAWHRAQTNQTRRAFKEHQPDRHAVKLLGAN